MLPADQVVIAVAVPLLGYRVLEELLKLPGLDVYGPVRTVDRALMFGRRAGTTLYICDDQLTSALIQEYPTWNGFIIRITAEETPQVPLHGPVVATLSIYDAGWDAQLRQLIGVEVLTEDPSTMHGRPERRRGQQIAVPLNHTLLTPSSGIIMPPLDSSTSLPGAAAFDEALRRLPAVHDPTYVLFVDVSEAAPPYRPAQRWFDQAGMKMRAAVRIGDLIFRLDKVLYALVAACGTEIGAQSLSTRLRWVVCGTDLVDPAHLVFAGSIWQPGTPVDMLLAEAWQVLSDAQAVLPPIPE